MVPAQQMDARMKARHSLEIDLRQAIIEGGFEVCYQSLTAGNLIALKINNRLQLISENGSKNRH
jgi:hypothetical protein